jgi:hypothetical protein
VEFAKRGSCRLQEVREPENHLNFLHSKETCNRRSEPR